MYLFFYVNYIFLTSLIFAITSNDNGDIIIESKHINEIESLERVNTSAYSLQNTHPSVYFRDHWFLCKYK